ncbi:GntR family transcriptional regulator [Motilibacter aurantiacus]|uniref:GntR family transcriptional regulator n=1 Tax=Motilibacter aurantiacus TaxID=2714955 RepID=UPI0014084756|nr:GntR family transcriptional regulator [Motilibacter aurantiacus]NHC44534.1 GntR family transcriptional regulator [Motilibacter aurantiacus]
MIALDPSSPVPPFEQLRAQLAGQVRTGQLAAGTRLPTVRRLADDLGLAPNTVARAYRELEQEGLVQTRGRNGTVVAAQDEQHRAAQEAAEAFARRARALGLPSTEALALVRAALGDS